MRHGPSATCRSNIMPAMPKPTVRFNVELTIKEGKLAAFEEIAKSMIAATQKEPGALTYAWHLSADRKRCRIILKVASLNRFEVYGDPGPQAAEMLAGFGAEIFPLWHGLSH